MEIDGVRILVKDLKKCFNFYRKDLDFLPTWGDENSDYASFDAGKLSAITLYKSDLMAEVLGNSSLSQPENAREKMMITIRVDDVDRSFGKLKNKGVKFLDEPRDMKSWGIRAVHLRDPEGNLIEIFSKLSPGKWNANLIEECTQNPPMEQ